MKETIADIDRLIGERIRFFRCARGWSLMEIAEKTGVSYQQFQKYEIGATRLSVARLVQIAFVLRSDPVQILPALPSPAIRPFGTADGPHGNTVSSSEGQRLADAYFALPAETRHAMLRLMEAVAVETRADHLAAKTRAG